MPVGTQPEYCSLTEQGRSGGRQCIGILLLVHHSLFYSSLHFLLSKLFPLAVEEEMIIESKMNSMHVKDCIIKRTLLNPGQLVM